MPSPDSKIGPLTQDDLLAIWKSSVDSEYARPFVEGGDGNGLEVYSQGFAQIARVSKAIDTTTQALYLRPYSGQSGPQASGAVNATVDLTINRSTRQQSVLVVSAGTVLFEEQEPDHSVLGTVMIATGRKYALNAPVVFMVGDSGPITASATAILPGPGYNNAQPSSISLINQPGTEFSNNLASLSVFVGSTALPYAVTIQCSPSPDVFVPQHVGQILSIVSSGAGNEGITGRVLSYTKPGVSDGGSVTVEIAHAAISTSHTGTFVIGETVDVLNGSNVVIARGSVLREIVDNLGAKQVAYAITYMPGSVSTAVSLLGTTSGATAVIAHAIEAPVPVAEIGTLSWAILDWVVDLGVTSTNVQQPSGGVLGMLDEIGRERGLPRASMEGDAHYSDRLWQIDDSISPNAIRRAINDVLVPLGLVGQLLEVGNASMPGIYYDAGTSSNGGEPGIAVDPSRNFAYDMDPLSRPADRWKTYFDFLEMRAFFVVSVPTLQLGNWGMFYDGDSADAIPFADAYDAGPPSGSFYDGFAAGQSDDYGTLYAAVAAAKAGGVTFDLVEQG